jgi:Signal transduction histidine kinase
METVQQGCMLLYKELTNIYRTKKDLIVEISTMPDISYLINLVMLKSELNKKGFNIQLRINETVNQDLLETMLGGICQIEYPTVKNKNQKNHNDLTVIVPITKIEKNEDASKIFPLCFSNLQGLKKYYTGKIIDDFLVAFIEIVQNIPYHSMGSTGLVAVIYENIPENPTLILAVTDFGIGIPNSLSELKSEYRYFWNDSFAVTLALKERVSRFKDKGRGKGLAGVYSFIKKHKGTLWIRSGRGLFVHKDEDYEASELQDWFPGVQCFIKLPLSQSFNKFS